MKPHRSRLDRVLDESRRIRDDARVLNVREQLWELHMALRNRNAEDAVLRGEMDQQAAPAASVQRILSVGSARGRRPHDASPDGDR